MPKLILMVGLPASGKSTYAEQLALKEDAVILSSDQLRGELYGDVNDTEHNNEVFAELHKRIKENLVKGNNVIWDSTNISYKKRKIFLEGIRKTNCTKECYFMATPYEVCLEQNSQRNRQVPEHVLKRMYKNIFIPQYYEGWDKIHIISNYNPNNFNTYELFFGKNGLNKINQDNPHHSLTIGEHCLKCGNNIMEMIKDDLLTTAGIYHDIGKRFTKEFKNAKGEDTKEAHYYRHELVSAYDALFYLQKLNQEDLLQVVKYITWHMQPFFVESGKAKDKFIKLVGQKCYDNLLILHESDIKAK